VTVWLPPTRADLFDWLQMIDTGEPGDLYDLALDVAAQAQRARCQVSPYTPALHAAVLRRAARFLAARGMALGSYDNGDYGQSYIPRWDTEIRDYESLHRFGSFA
jgi:hypothetical protein